MPEELECITGGFDICYKSEFKEEIQYLKKVISNLWDASMEGDGFDDSLISELKAKDIIE